MSGHAGLDDIFGTATQFAGAVLNDLDERNRKKEDAFIKTVLDWFETEINKYTREYQKKQQNFIRESFAKKFGSNAGIGYYKQAMDQTQTHEIMIKRRLLVYYRCSEEQLPVVAKAGAETDPVRTINNR